MEIENHIRNFRTSGSFPESEMNITLMYKAYAKDTQEPLSIHVYRKIFKEIESGTSEERDCEEDNSDVDVAEFLDLQLEVKL